MLPKSSKHYIIPTADELEVDSDLVRSVTAFYYGEVRKALSTFKGNNIMLDELGTFSLKRKEVKKLKFKYEGQIEALGSNTVIRPKLAKSLENIERIDQFLQEEYKRKGEFIKKKKNEKR